MSEFQNSATHEQIKECVLCKTGLKVSSLCISKVEVWPGSGKTL